VKISGFGGHQIIKVRRTWSSCWIEAPSLKPYYREAMNLNIADRSTRAIVAAAAVFLMSTSHQM
jgi:hypothetical protein